MTRFDLSQLTDAKWTFSTRRVDRAVVAAGDTAFDQARPGDLILGDADGLIALNPALARAHLAGASTKLDLEQRWISQLAAGQSAKDVFGL